MTKESISVPPSEESGNVSVETETTVPAETTTTETPTENMESVVPTETSKVETFKLPDGREVTGEELYKEHTEKLIPEFTRRSQELAELKKGSEHINKPTNPLEDPDYVPQTYAELAVKIKEETLREIEGRESAKVQQQKAIEDAVSSQLTEIKKADPTMNENALFLHANKYGFRDLKQAHQNMKDMSDMAKKVQQTTAANIAKRTDAVSTTPGATGARPEPSQFATAQDYLRAVKASGK